MRSCGKGKQMKVTRNKSLYRLVGLLALLTIMLALASSSRTGLAANAPSEQVIFSGIGFADTGAWQSPVGFWIWCQAEGTGPYGQDHECAGAMYVYFQGIVVGVDGEVTEEGDETYTMDVASRKTGVLSATLHNLSDELNPGPNNSVEFTVTTAAGVASGVTNTAVVKVTGPGD
jgi:hypothetical protein